jgi:hypothetical protein
VVNPQVPSRVPIDTAKDGFGASKIGSGRDNGYVTGSQDVEVLSGAKRGVRRKKKGIDRFNIVVVGGKGVGRTR